MKLLATWKAVDQPGQESYNVHNFLRVFETELVYNSP